MAAEKCFKYVFVLSYTTKSKISILIVKLIFLTYSFFLHELHAGLDAPVECINCTMLLLCYMATDER